MGLPSSALLCRIEGLRSLAVNPQIALRLVELGDNPEAELDDYVQLVRLDASLSVRILALANSTWFSPQHPITTVRRALGMLGINNTRALAVSHCLSSLFGVLRLDAGCSRAYWEAAVCKAVAAKWLAQRSPGRRGEEGMAIGLLQDLGVGLLAATDPQDYPHLLSDPGTDLEMQLRFEVERFGIDHAEAGSLVARKLGLPALFQDLIGQHHRLPEASPSTGQGALSQASHTVSFLPHDFRAWNPRNGEALASTLQTCYAGQWPSARTFSEAIHAEFATLVAILGDGAAPPTSLSHLLDQGDARAAAA